MQGRTVKLISAAAAILAAAVIYWKFDPSSAGFFPKCPLRSLTGLSCPGCGSQRALHHLLHLQIRTAFGYNAALVLSIPLLMVISGASLFKEKVPRLYAFTLSRGFSVSVIAAILLWWILRNVWNRL